MATKKFSDEPDKMFVRESQYSDITESVSVKIKDFTKEINDLDLDNKKPINSKLEREIKIMDTDGNGTIDRLEWLSYLCSPQMPGSDTLG